MAFTSFASNYGKYLIATQALDWTAGTIKIVPVGSGYTADPDAQFLSSASANLLGASGDRYTLATRTIAQVNADDKVELRCADPVYTALDVGAVHGFLVVKDTGDDATSPILGGLSGGSYPKTTNGGGFTVDLPGYAFRF